MAVPQLRLSTTALGPVFVAVGQNGPDQSITASNAGDGQLSPSASSNVSWLAPTVAASTVKIGLNTSTLTRGSYTGVVTVTAPNALDAPQTVVVTVQIGSSLSDSVDLYLPPGGSASASFFTPNVATASVTSPPNGATLSLTVPGSGSFAFSYSYTVKAAAPAGTPDNDYAGSLHLSGSIFASDNRTVPVTAHVTSLPIATWNATPFKLVQGAAKASQQVSFSNAGMGTLTLASATTTAAWLTAAVQGNTVSLMADPTGLSPGVYLTTVTVPSNAKNSPSAIAVELDVSASGPPFSYYKGVVDNAIFKVGDPVAPGDILAIFGEQFTAQDPILASALPLQNTMDGATVFVNDVPSPLYYVSPGQIDFAVPYSTAPGLAQVRVDQGSLRGNSVSVMVQPAVPRLLQQGNGYAVATLADNMTFPMPAAPGVPSRPAQAGVDTIVFYAIGLGQTSPPASDGQAAPAGQIAPSKMVFAQSLFAGIIEATPAYAGLSPGSVGLYQINVLVPANSPRGTIPVYLDMGNGIITNSVNIAIQ